MMKKVIYFLLAFVMLLSFSAVVFASESSKMMVSKLELFMLEWRPVLLIQQIYL